MQDVVHEHDEDGLVEVVTLEGNIAVGKSTVIGSLRGFGAYVVPEPVKDWDDLLHLFYEDPHVYSFPLQARILACVTRDRRQHVVAAKNKGYLRLFMERSPLGAKVFTKAGLEAGHMSAEDFALYNRLEVLCKDEPVEHRLRKLGEVLGDRLSSDAPHDAKTLAMLRELCVNDDVDIRVKVVHVLLQAPVATCVTRCKRRDRPDERDGPLTGSDQKLTTYLTHLHRLQSEVFPVDAMLCVDATKNPANTARGILRALCGFPPVSELVAVK